MACVINYNNKTYSLEDFKNILLKDSSLVKEVANKSQEKLKAIQEVFNSNPELSKVGDVFYYAIYLDTVFPDSKVKDIVYHGSKNKFEKFDKSKLGSNTNPNKEFPQFNDSYLGFHFTSNPEYYRSRFEFGSKYEKNLNEYIAILNIQKSKDIADKDEFSQNNIQFIKPEDVKNNDSIIYDYLDTVHYEKGNIYTNNYVVFEPEQIHILSSKKDLEMFRNFINFTKSEYAKYGDIQQFKDYIMSKNFAAIEEFLVVNNKIDRKC